MKKFLSIVIPALLLVSCAREWMPEEVPVEEGLVERTWTVAMDDGARATLDVNLRPVWEVGEELSVYDHVTHEGRIFTVTSVDGNVATVTGTISAGGDTPFDAFYPARSGEWTSDGTGTMKLPETQSIPAGRQVCPDVLVSTAHNDVPDGVIPFHNIASLLKVEVGREGISDIRIDLVGASEDDVRTYRAQAASGTLATGTYFIAVDPGTYAGGLRATCAEPFGQAYRRVSTTPLEAGVGGMLSLGTISNGKPWRYYEVTATKPYANQDALLEETGLLGNMGAIQGWLGILFPDRGKPVSAISYTYRSADPQGNPVDLSAVVYIPDSALEKTKLLTGISLTNHGTIASNAECPTLKAQFEGALAWKNYAMVMPDYYGFGVSADRPQAYLDPETTARGNIDAYLAACQLLEDRQVAIPDRLYSFGYSQGGFNSMANLKYVSAHPELGIQFNKVMCGGSPFDVMLTWNAYTNGSFHNSLAFVPMTLVSINETHQLGLSYDDLFKGPLLDNWQEWILSKRYTTTEISSLLSPDPEHPSAISDILDDRLVAGQGDAFSAIQAVGDSYSLASGWTPPSGTKIFLYHSNQDDTVPYANLPAMKTFLNQVAPGSYVAYDGNDGGHMEAVVSYVIDIIFEW